MRRRHALSLLPSATLLALGVPLTARADRDGDGGIVGSWSGVATSTTLPVPPVRVQLTLGADGTVVESRRLYLPASPLGPVLATPGHGAWRRTGVHEYALTIQLLYEGAAGHPTAEGQIVGSEKVRFRVLLVNGGRRLQGVVQVEIKDTAGNVVFSGPGTFEADRIRVEPLP